MINISKSCNQCKKILPLINFYKKKSCKYGVMSICKICWKQKVHDFQNLNKDIIKEKKSQHYLDNKEKYSERSKQNYLKNPELRKEKQRKYNNLNKEKRKKYNQQPHIKKRNNDYSKQYYKSSPEKHIAKNISCSISMRVREINSKKDQKTLNIIGLNNWEEFKKHLESQFSEGMNWDNYGNNVKTDWSIDHIIPISLATTLEEVKKLNHYTNLRPMWHIDNIKKRDKLYFPIKKDRGI